MMPFFAIYAIRSTCNFAGRNLSSAKAQIVPPPFSLLNFCAKAVESSLPFLPFLAINAINGNRQMVVNCHFSAGCIYEINTPKNGRPICMAKMDRKTLHGTRERNTHTCS